MRKRITFTYLADSICWKSQAFKKGTKYKQLLLKFIQIMYLLFQYLLFTPTTPCHEIHLWFRQDKRFPKAPLTIKHRMSDRYANIVYNDYLVVYRNTLFSLYLCNKDINIRQGSCVPIFVSLKIHHASLLILTQSILRAS